MKKPFAFSKVKALGSVGMPEESTPICLAGGTSTAKLNQSGSEVITFIHGSEVTATQVRETPCAESLF